MIETMPLNRFTGNKEQKIRPDIRGDRPLEPTEHHQKATSAKDRLYLTADDNDALD